MQIRSLPMPDPQLPSISMSNSLSNQKVAIYRHHEQTTSTKLIKELCRFARQIKPTEKQTNKQINFVMIVQRVCVSLPSSTQRQNPQTHPQNK